MIETKRVILARFVDFEVTLINVLPWQLEVKFSKPFSFIEKFIKKQFEQLRIDNSGDISGSL